MQYGLEKSVLAFSDEIQEALCHVRWPRSSLLPHMAAMKFKLYFSFKTYFNFIKISKQKFILWGFGVLGFCTTCSRGKHRKILSNIRKKLRQIAGHSCMVRATLPAEAVGMDHSPYDQRARSACLGVP